jgi:four helix bundle protein
VAANIEEAQSACSKDDFIYKVGISLKEARETNLWLRLLKDGDVVDKKESLEAIIKESEEVMNILASIIKSAKAKNK